MKTTTIELPFILFLAVIQVNAASLPSFQNGKIYVYAYEGRVATGISETDVKHFSGFGVKSNLTVFINDAKAYFKFDGTTVGRVNKKIGDFFAPLPIEYAVPEDPVIKDTVDRIEKPFVAIYENGAFNSYYDPKDSMSNWRKSVVGIFQTQFNPTENQDSDFFKIYEEGVGGKCKTLYTIAHIPSEETHVQEVLNVTKVRLYDECETRPHYFFSSMEGYKCSHCKQENPVALKTLGRTEYEIRGNKYQFTIEKVYSSGTVIFTPFTTNGQTVFSIVNQSLSLESETQDAMPFEVDVKDYEEHNTLAFEFYPETLKDDQELNNYYYNRIYKKPVTSNPVQELLPKLAILAQDYRESGKESQAVIRILNYLQKFAFEHFVELFRKHIYSGEQDTKEKKAIKFMLYEVLPYVGTNAAVKYMLQLIEYQRVDKHTATEMINKFPFYVKELCPEIMEMMETFLRKEEVTNYLRTWHTGALAYGTLVNKACVRKSPFRSQFDKDPELCAKYVKFLKDKYYSVLLADPKEASIYLKVLKNTEHPDAYEIFARVLKDDKFPLLLRKTAVWSILHYHQEKSEEIASMLVPLFFDRRNDYTLRIYAFDVLFHLYPTKEFFSGLTSKLKTEPNEKVASYIFDTLATLTNTTDPCYEDLGEKAKNVLQLVEPKQDYDIFRHSTNRMFSAYNAKYNFGRSSQFAMVPSEHSVIPRELYMRHSFNLLGYNYNFLEVGFTADEHSALSHLADYFGPAGVWKGHGNGSADHIKDIVAKLHLDKFRQHDNDARYEIFVKMFDRYVKLTQGYNFDDSTKIFVDGDKLMFNLGTVTYTEVEYVVPNEMGFPVILSVKVPATMYMRGSVKLQHHLTEEYACNIDVDATIGSDFSIIAMMYVYTPTFRRYGYQLKTNAGYKFPIKSSLDFDTCTKKFALKYTPLTEAHEIIHYDTTPEIIFPEEPFYYPIKYSEHPVNKKYKFGHDYFGVGIKSSIVYDYVWNDDGSYNEFFRSFFHKSTRYEDYFHLADKWFAGTHGFLDYASINPSAKPFHFRVKLEPSKTHPTTEFLLTNNNNHSKYFEEDEGHDTYESTLSLVARGPVERRWDAQINVYNTYPEEDFREVEVHYERSPIPNYDDKKFELHYESNVTYVNYMTVFTDKPAEVSIKYYGKLLIGSEEDGDPKEIYVTMLAEQTEEHKSANKSNIWFHQKCKEEREQHKAEFTDACFRVIRDDGRVDKITFDFELRNIPIEYKGFAYHVYTWFRHSFYNNLRIGHFDGSNEENHTNVVANFSYHYPVFDLKITRPDHTVYYNKIYAPSIVPKYEPFTIAEAAKDRFKRKFLNYQQPACFVTGDRVQTFDGVVYPFNEDDNKCYQLAMGDCVNHHFFVFVKKLDNPKMDKAVKFYFHGDIIEVVPKADGEGLDFFLNDEQKEGTVGFIFPITNHPNYKLTVSYWSVSGVYIESDEYGVQLFTDGKDTCFLANNFFRGKQCGLCGDLDGETRHEFKKPDGTPITYAEISQYYRYSSDNSSEC